MKKLLIVSLIFCLIPLQSVKAQTTYKSYYCPVYNNNTLDSQIRVGNIGTTSTTINITIGANLMGTYTIAANTQARYAYAGVDSGPVKIISSGQPIVASIRIFATTYGTGMYEIMCVPIDLTTTPTATSTATPTGVQPPTHTSTSTSTPATSTIVPTSTPIVSSLCPDGTGFPYYPMCQGVLNPVFFYSMTANYNSANGMISNVVETSARGAGDQQFVINTSCSAMFGHEKLYTLYNKNNIGFTVAPQTFDTNMGKQRWLGEVQNPGGASPDPIAMVPLNPVPGTVIDGDISFWYYNPANPSTSCDNATILLPHWYYQARVVDVYSSYTFNGVTYNDVVIVTLREFLELSGGDGPDTVYMYGFRRNTGNVFTCYGALNGSAITGNCWQAVQ